MSNKKTLATYINILNKCANRENPLPKVSKPEGTKGAEQDELINKTLKELEEKKWISVKHGQYGNWHFLSEVDITCEGLIGLAEIKKIVLENNPVYLSLLSFQNMLFIVFTAILTVGGKIAYDLLSKSLG